MIECKNITKSFGDIQVLKNVSLTINTNEIVSIVGPSGAGKTTLLQILGSLDKPTSGEVFIDNVSLNSLNDEKLAQFRNRKIGFVFQFHQLLPEFTSIENCMIPALIKGENKKTAYQKAEELLDFLGISHRLTHKPAELSGGEKQRVAIARALINNPSVVFADEPSGNLDTKNRDDLMELFVRCKNRFQQSFVIVTHDENIATNSDRIIHLKDGLIV